MPKLSEAMESGKIIKWLKKEGDRVQAGDILAEVETDKADVEMEAFGSGVLRKILLPAGQHGARGLAHRRDRRARRGHRRGGRARRAPQRRRRRQLRRPLRPPRPRRQCRAVRAAVPPQPRREDPAARTPSPASAPTAPTRTAPAAAAPATALRPAAAASPAPGDGGRLKASPLARKIAAQSGVDLHAGPRQRPRRPHHSPRRRGGRGRAGRAAGRPPAVAPGAEFEDRPLSQIRATIAKRMPLSKAPVPALLRHVRGRDGSRVELREQLNALEGQPKISVNDLVLRACALALLQHPGVNASFQGESIRVYHRAHIGIAVALEDGLITPVLRDVQAKSLAQIAAEARDLAERARERKLRAQEMSGATFSISNLGMFDVTEFSAIINPPEGAILAVGAVRRVPVVDADGLGVGRRMMLTLSCDHRVMDGAMGARFLQDVKRLLEEPLRLLV